jgi:hypothetical protein
MAPNHENSLSWGLIVFVHGQKLGRGFPVSAQVYNGQICLTTGEKADHGNAFPSSPPLLSSSSFQTSSSYSPSSRMALLFYFIVFIITFRQIFILQKKEKFQSSFPLNVPMALYLAVSYHDDLSVTTKSDTSDE